MGDHPVQDGLLLKDHIGPAVVIAVDAPLGEVILAGGLNLEDAVNFLLAPALPFIGCPQPVIGLPRARSTP